MTKQFRTFEPTVRGTAQAIMQMEVDLGLLDDETYGPFARLVWESSRFTIHDELKQTVCGHGRSHPPKTGFLDRSHLQKVRWSMQFLYNALWCGWLRAPRKREWLILQNPRRKLNSAGLYGDLYTDELILSIHRRNRIALEDSYYSNHFQPTPQKVWYTEATALLGWATMPFTALKISKDIRNVLRMGRLLETYLSRIFGVRLSFRTLLRKKASSLARSLAGNRLMLSWIKPSKVLLVCSYGKEGLIKAAHDLNIPCVDVQHGVITPEHLGYAFKSGTAKSSFPDYVLVFGEYWRRTVPWPIPSDRVVAIGSPSFDRDQVSVGSIKKEKRVVLIGQGSIGNELSKFAVSLGTLVNDDTEVIYKLHPTEVNIWKQSYPWLLDAYNKKTVMVIGNEHPTLFELLASARWQIGVYSTAIFEGLGLRCITFLVDLPGIEYMEPLVRDRVVQVVSDAAEIDWYFTPQGFDTNDFFAPDWKANFRRFLNRRHVRCDQTASVR